MWVSSCHWAASSSSDGRCAGAQVAARLSRVARLVGDLQRLVGQRQEQLLAGGELRQVEVDRPVGEHAAAHREAELAVEVAGEQLAGDAVAHVVAEQVDLGRARARRRRPRSCRRRRGSRSGGRACPTARSRRSRAGSPAAAPPARRARTRSRRSWWGSRGARAAAGAPAVGGGRLVAHEDLVAADVVEGAGRPPGLDAHVSPASARRSASRRCGRRRRRSARRRRARRGASAGRPAPRERRRPRRAARHGVGGRLAVVEEQLADDVAQALAASGRRRG